MEIVWSDPYARFGRGDRAPIFRYYFQTMFIALILSAAFTLPILIPNMARPTLGCNPLSRRGVEIGAFVHISVRSGRNEVVVSGHCNACRGQVSNRNVMGSSMSRPLPLSGVLHHQQFGARNLTRSSCGGAPLLCRTYCGAFILWITI